MIPLVLTFIAKYAPELATSPQTNLVILGKDHKHGLPCDPCTGHVFQLMETGKHDATSHLLPTLR